MIENLQIYAKRSKSRKNILNIFRKFTYTAWGARRCIFAGHLSGLTEVTEICIQLDDLGHALHCYREFGQLLRRVKFEIPMLRFIVILCCPKLEMFVLQTTTD